MAVGKAKAAHTGLVNEVLVGPAADGGWVGAMQPGGWLQQVFAKGALQYFDAVSVHP